MSRGPLLVDWEAVYRRLMFGRGRIPLAAVGRMTEVEIDFVLDDDVERVRPPAGADATGPAEVAAHIRRLRGMTAAERLEWSRRKRGY